MAQWQGRFAQRCVFIPEKSLTAHAVVSNTPPYRSHSLQFRGFTREQNSLVQAGRNQQLCVVPGCALQIQSLIFWRRDEASVRKAADVAEERSRAVQATLVRRAQDQAASGVEQFKRNQSAATAAHLQAQREEKKEADAKVAAHLRAPHTGDPLRKFETSAR